MNINELSIKEKIGQKFIFGINSHDIDDIIYLIKNYCIGGVILYRKNYSNYQEMLSVIKKLKSANKGNKIPLFIAIDQEGGVVNRLPKEIKNLKNVYDISKVSNDLVYDSSNIIGSILKNSGINMNLAPVLDIYNNSKSKALYNRCFYGDVAEIYNSGIKYIKGLSDKGIISVCKHFPGHGISKVDSHFLIPFVFNYKDVLNKHIVPFKKVINDGVDAIMVGHLVIRKLTGFLPASISKKIIIKYLREEFNYNGLVITDEIKMLSRSILYRFFYMNKAINSGSDIILVKIKNKEDGIKILNKANKLILDNKQLADNIKRIINVKNKYNVNDDINFTGCDIDKVNKKIDKINNFINNNLKV